jgi:hypothetical protein
MTNPETEHLMQDIDRGLAIWFASRLDAREVVRRWWREEGVML